MKNTAGATFQLGLVAAIVGVAALHARIIAPEPYDLLASSRTPWWVVVTAVTVAGSYGLGLPELPTSRRQGVLRALGAVAAAVGVVSFAQFSLASPLLPRSSLAVLLVIVPTWAVVCWNLAQDVESWQSLRDQVFLVAAEPGEPAALAHELGARPERPATVVGSLPVGEATLGRDGRARLVEAVEATTATVVVLDTTAQSDDGIVQQVVELHRRGLRIRTLALFYEEWLGKLPLAELARVSLLFDIGELHRARYVRAKRVIDIVLGIVGTAALVVVVPVVAVGNRLGNRGPLFYSQRRVGKDGTEFTMHKFRTMVPAVSPSAPPPLSSADPEAVGERVGGDAAVTTTVWTARNDPRVTSFGGLLRRTHLDELPQMINVLRGELSIVGPRPEQPHYVDELSEKIPFYEVRHLVRPGLTGWAQVKQGYAADEADALEKLQYDVYYLRRQRLGIDVAIIWRTVRDVVAGLGR